MKTTITLIPERIEVPCIKRGKPSYRWANGYYVCDPAKGLPLGNAKIYPPVVRREAYALARDIAGADCKIVIEG